VSVEVAVGVAVEVAVGADVVGAGVVGAVVVGAAVVGAVVVGAAVVGAAVVGAAVVGAAVVGAAVVGAAVVGATDVLADALADALATCSGSQDSLLPAAVAAAAVLPFRAATTPPEAAVSRALPAIKVTARRRPCAIRILIHIDRYHCEINHLQWSSLTTFSTRFDTVRRYLGLKPDIGLAFGER
jgi:hypothetical protein